MPGGIPPVDLMYYVPVFCMSKTARSVCEPKKSDGACEEGTSYWGHAAGKLYDYLQILSDGTGGKISLFNEPMIRRMGEYMSRSYVGNGWVVNFATGWG